MVNSKALRMLKKIKQKSDQPVEPTEKIKVEEKVESR